MGCHLAENEPLKRLRNDLGLPDQCHSLRSRCIQRFESRNGNGVLGAPGAVIGYCQALFNYAGSPTSHTESVIRLLKEIEAPWANSHELFWGFRHQETPLEFLRDGMMPLVGSGRVPILITGLDPAQNRSEIESIVATEPKISPGETVLVRVTLSDNDSVASIAEIIATLLRRSIETSQMPKWWPLLQTNAGVPQWRRLKDELGKAWRYVNIAVNPFAAPEMLDVCKEQVTVGQIVLGASEDIHDDGWIRLPDNMRILGAAPGAGYNLPDYLSRLGKLSAAPTLIILGPSQPNWSNEHNQDRIAALLPLLRQGCETLWRQLTSVRREAVWKLAA
jgi:hypothetical protein